MNKSRLTQNKNAAQEPPQAEEMAAAAPQLPDGTEDRRKSAALPWTMFMLIFCGILAYAGYVIYQKKFPNTPAASRNSPPTQTQTKEDEFILIPAGDFVMGDAKGVGESNEKPVHKVSVSNFCIASTEVTKKQWDAVWEWGLAHGYTDIAAGESAGANHPVTDISWHDVVKWCNARSEKEGLAPCYTVSGSIYRRGNEDTVACNWRATGYRLPTEAEWEKAARGGLVGRNYPNGDELSTNEAQFSSSGTAQVRSYPANGYGLHDMAGNVWEWCWDWWESDYYGSSPVSDPRGSVSSWERVVRGGGSSNCAADCRVAFRTRSHRTLRSDNLGFRPARSSVP